MPSAIGCPWVFLKLAHQRSTAYGNQRNRLRAFLLHHFWGFFMNGSPQVLVVSSDLNHRQALTVILQQEGWIPLHASHLTECRDLLTKQNIGLIFCERRIADGTYQDLLAFAQTSERRVPIVVTSRLADWDEYLEALRHGAVDLIASPCMPRDVSSAIAQAQRENLQPATNPQSQSEPKLHAISAHSA
jgi:DNA-binding NtrC family response regulator